jgi:hypothetical protein
MHTDITVLDNLVAVNLSVTIWSARRKLTAEDFSGAGNERSGCAVRA